MPKNNDISSILVIGAGPIIIGQACEFDYSGVQACKALNEEGIKTILVNSNPATIMTDPEMADKIYIEPIHWRNIEKIIAIEKPDAILPTMGGQTALNTTLDLNRHKILQKYGGMVVPDSFMCMKSLKSVYEGNIYDDKMFAVESINRGVSMNDSVRSRFAPNMYLWVAKKGILNWRL